MAILDESAKGVFIIAVTPFSDDGSLDLASTDRMVDSYIERGVTGITILGIMGEAAKLTVDESRRFAKRVINRVAGKFLSWLAHRRRDWRRCLSLPRA